MVRLHCSSGRLKDRQTDRQAATATALNGKPAKWQEQTKNNNNKNNSAQNKETVGSDAERRRRRGKKS